MEAVDLTPLYRSRRRSHDHRICQGAVGNEGPGLLLSGERVSGPSRASSPSVRSLGRAFLNTDGEATPPMPAFRPVWPPGLTEQAPLPFALWRILHHMNGQRTTGEIAQLAGVTPGDVSVAVVQAAAWVTRTLAQAQDVTPAQSRLIVECLTGVLGPMAEFVVDDALDDLGGRAPLGALLSRLAAGLTEAQRQTFAQHLRARNLT